MKKYIFSILVLSTLILHSQEKKEYENGVMLWGLFDMLKGEVSGKLEKYAKLIKIQKNGSVYTLFLEDKKGKFTTMYRKTKGFSEENKYVDEFGTIYYIKDLLDTEVKAIDIISTVPLPNLEYKAMILRVFIK